jgi:ATP-dependent Clp protease ATP-binding subunit ClpA
MQDALSRGNPEVTVDHVLVALMSQTETIVAPLLAKVGVASTMIRDRALESVGRQPTAQGGSEPRMSRELTNKLATNTARI